MDLEAFVRDIGASRKDILDLDRAGDRAVRFPQLDSRGGLSRKIERAMDLNEFGSGEIGSIGSHSHRGQAECPSIRPITAPQRGVV